MIHLTIRHEQGALSSVFASWEIHDYRRPALELYGTEGTANLLGDDWDPRGYQLYRADDRAWREVDAVDPTWLWTDGLRELVEALREGRDPVTNLEQDMHLLEVLDAARRSAAGRAAVALTSRFERVDLRVTRDALGVGHIHDHTRPPEEQRYEAGRAGLASKPALGSTLDCRAGNRVRAVPDAFVASASLT